MNFEEFWMKMQPVDSLALKWVFEDCWREAVEYERARMRAAYLSSAFSSRPLPVNRVSG